MTYQTYIKQAIKGVSSDYSPEPDASEPLRSTLKKVQSPSPGASFLSQATTHYFYELAGQEPCIADQLRTNPAPAEDRPYINQKCRNLLQFFLSEDLPQLEEEFFYIAHQNKQILPPEFLPPYLDRIAGGNLEGSYFLQIMGNRGDWLIAQNPNWQNLSRPGQAELSQELWEYGNKDERLDYLRSVRSRDPGQALTLVQATWTKEKPKTKLLLLEILEQNLSSTDEEFLHSVWQKGPTEVAQAAVKLLSQITDSRHQQRMSEVLKNIFTLKKQLLKGKTLQLNLGEDAWIDYLELTADHLSKRADMEFVEWFTRFLSLVNLDYWTDLIQDPSPAKFLELALKNSLKNSVWLEGLTRAAIIQKRADWLESLFWHRPSAEAVNLLTPEFLSNFVIQTKNHNFGRKGNPLGLIADNYEARVDSPYFANDAIIELTQHLLKELKIKDFWRYRRKEPIPILTKWMYYLNPQICPEVANLLRKKVESAGLDPNNDYFEVSLQILDYRHKLHQSFSSL